MKHIKLIVSFWALLTAAHLSAQQPLVLLLPDTVVRNNDTLRLDITVRQFTDIGSIQFSLKWDTLVMRYVNFEQSDLTFVAVGATANARNALRFSWIDFEGNGKTLANGKSMVRLKFFVKGTPGASTALTFSDTPLPIEIARAKTTGSGFEAIPLTPQNGKVTIEGGSTGTILQANFVITDVRCANGSDGAINTTVRNAPIGATVRWTGPDNFQSQQEDIANLKAGTYTFAILNNTGGTLLDTTFTVRQPARALAIDTITTDSAGCQPTGRATITASGGTAPYSYRIGNNFVNTNQFANLAAGRYTLTVRDSNSCTVSDTFTIAASKAQVTIDTIVTTQAGCGVATGTALATAKGGVAPYSYSINNNFVPTNQFASLAAGIYTLTVRDANNCTASATFNILTSNSQIIIDTIITASSGCTQATGTAIVNARGGTTPYSYSVGNNFINTNQFANLAAGRYTLTVRDANNCTTSDTFSIRTSNPPQVELGDTVFVCQGENTMLDAGVQTTYRWSNGATTRSISVANPGIYSVTVSNTVGCTASDSVRVQAGNTFNLKIENDTLAVCPQKSLQLRASAAETYRWIDTSKTLSKLDIANPIAKPRFTSRYTVIASNGCNADTASVEVQVFKTEATAGPDTCVAPGAILELYASGGDAYFWFLSEYSVSNPRISNPTTEPEDSTSYYVMITDINGCQILDTIDVMVANNPLDILAVNMITPNGDGKNDALEFSGLAKYGLNTLKVYNRWGDLVYQKIDYQKDEERFDGTRNGKPLPAGNYFYVLSFKTGDVKQTLTILRN